MTDITRRIIEVKDKNGLNDRQLELGANLPPASLQAWRHGKKNKKGEMVEVEPSTKSIISIAKFLNVSTDYLLGISDLTYVPTSWLLFRDKILNNLNKTLEEIAAEIKQPVSIFKDWELGEEPDGQTAWAICNALQASNTQWKALKNSLLAVSPNNNILSAKDIELMLAENNGLDWLEKLYKELKEQRQKAYVLLWIVQYLASEGLPVKQILGK